MSIKSFQDFHMLNEGKKLKDWQYTGTVSVGSNNAIYYQYPNNVKYYVSVTPEELEDYLEGGSLRKKLEKQWADSGKAMTREEFEAKYMPKGPQGLGKYLSQGGRMWDHVESSEDDMYVEAARSWELMETSHIKHEVRKIMKLAKNRPAPFSVVAIKDGKVIAQDIDIKIWQSILAHYREMAKAHPGAKIHVEDAEGQSVMYGIAESVDRSNFNQLAYLSSVEYQKVKKLKNFNAADWKWDSKKDLYKNVRIEESVNEAGGTIAKGAYSFADYFGIPVSRLKGFKFDGTDDVEELHKVLGRASSNIKGTENIYKASITESADMLPSFEVIAGLATVLGALDLAQAVKGGNSIIVDVTKALKAELGDRLEATGTEAKRVIDKFKGNSKVKEIIMDAEEEVNESKKSTIMKISLFEEYFNEGKKDYAARYNGVDINLKNGYKYLKDHELEDLYTKIGKLLKGKTTMAKRVDVVFESINEATETGLMVVPRTNADANKIQKWVDKSGMHGEWDAKEGYFLFPEEEDGFDELEMELTKELDKLGVNYRIEGVFESKRQETAKIKLFEEYFNEADIKIYKTISKKEWDKTPKDYKSIIDGVHYKMFFDPKMETILAPVEIKE